MQSDQLVTAQRVVQLLDALVIVLPLLTLVFLVAALLVSPHRRRTLLQLGLAISMLLVLLLIKLMQRQVVAAVTAQPGAGIIAPALDALLGSLLQWLVLLLLGGVLLALVAFFANKGHWFAAARRWLWETLDQIRGGRMWGVNRAA